MWSVYPEGRKKMMLIDEKYRKACFAGRVLMVMKAHDE